MIKNYRIGIVQARGGLSEYQLKELISKVRETSKLVEGLILKVPAYCKAEPLTTLDNGILQLAKRMETYGTVLEVGAYDHRPHVKDIAEWLGDCDELLGYPANGRGSLHQDRVMMLAKILPKMKITGPWLSTNGGCSVEVGKTQGRRLGRR